jgi:uncharacterized integral membrane protein (TIGR00698 family)
LTRKLLGLGVAGLGLGLALAVHALVPAIPMLTMCVVLGALFGNLAPVSARDAARPGLSFATKVLLRVKIVLLGLKLSLIDIAGLGWLTLVLVVVIVVVTFVLTWLVGRLAGLPGQQPLLIAAGFSICGASAIGAMAAVTKSRDEETATPVALVTLCGTIAIGLLPLLAVPLGLTGADFGMWVGASVHDVGQVVATAQIAGAAALAIAIVVKLTRVLLLAPMVAATGLLLRTEGKRPPIVPLFVAGFIVAMLVRSFVPLPEVVLSIADIAQTVLLGLALVGLGSAIRIPVLVRTGGKAALVGLFSWALIATLGYGLVLVASAS